MPVSLAIKNRFGSKKGMLRFFAHEVLRLLGFYRQLAAIDFAQVKRLVFVCQGNICRSPLGEAVARKQGMPTISFGLDAHGGDSADPRAIAWAQTNGYDLQTHITQGIDQYEPQAGDLLIGMEPKHIHKLQATFAQASVQITLIGLWLESPLAYLHDPFNANSDYFSHCEDLVKAGAIAILQFCKNSNVRGI